MAKVNNELYLFDSALERKPQLVAVNKIDLPQVETRRDEINDSFSSAGVEVHFIAAATGEGVPQLMRAALRLLSESAPEKEAGESVTRKVFRPQARNVKAGVERE